MLRSRGSRMAGLYYHPGMLAGIVCALCYLYSSTGTHVCQERRRIFVRLFFEEENLTPTLSLRKERESEFSKGT